MFDLSKLWYVIWAWWDVEVTHKHTNIFYATDSTTIAKLQNIFHEYERSIQKARSRHGYLADKVSQMEMERSELKLSLEESRDDKSALERNQLELKTEVTNLKWDRPSFFKHYRTL